LPALAQCAAEFVGTTLLCLTQLLLRLSVVRKDLDLTGYGIASGALLASLAYGLGHLSGAHFNSAVTIAVAAKGVMPLPTFGGYLLVQVLAAFLAAGFFRALFSDVWVDAVTEHPLNGLTNGGGQLLLTFFLTISLCIAFVGIASRGRAASLHSCLAYGAAYAAAATAGGPWGISANPNLSLISIFSGFHVGEVWIQLVGGLGGSLTAAVLCGFMLGGSQSSPLLAEMNEPQRDVDTKAVLTGWDATDHHAGAGTSAEEGLLRGRGQRTGERSREVPPLQSIDAEW
jgi:aquaporin NIP